MAIKYLYLDDQDSSTVTSIADAVSGGANDLDIEVQHPSRLGSDLDKLEDIVENFDGLILDWRLDELGLGAERPFPFRAASIAQEIRTRQTEARLRSIPIVLWSTDDKLRNSFTPDLTNRDLFDASQDKIEIAENHEQVRLELLSLADGYQQIRTFTTDLATQADSVLDLLKLDGSFKESLPKSFLDFLHVWNEEARHVVARQLLREVIQRPGVLVDESLLAARLGVDRASGDWSALLEQLSPYSYRGPFIYLQRWWWHSIVRFWWRDADERTDNILSLVAKERVDRLKSRSGLTDLVPASTIGTNYSTYFQSVCEHYGTPLDKIDGVIINESDPASWQERRYLSLKAVLERRYNPKLVRPHPSENARLVSMASESEDDEA